MLTRHRPRAAVDEPQAAPAQPALQAEPARCSRASPAPSRALRRPVDRYLIWNEPNQPGLAASRSRPACARRVCTPASPHLYRGLVRAARPAIQRADPGAQVVLGELAPRGRPRRSRRAARSSPLPFLRAMGCVDRRYQPDPPRRRAAASSPRAPTPSATTRTASSSAPDQPNPDRDEAQFADLPRLFAVLDRLTRAGPDRRAGRPLRRLPDRVRLPDLAARPRASGSRLRLPDALPAAGRLPRVAAPARPRPHPLPVGGRAGRRQRRRAAGLRGLAVGPALRQRPAEAGASAASPSRSWSTTRTGRTRARFWGQVRPGSGVRSRHDPAAPPGPSARLPALLTRRCTTDAARLLDAHAAGRQRRAQYRYSWEQAAVTAGGRARRAGCRASSTCAHATRRGAWHAVATP